MFPEFWAAPSTCILYFPVHDLDRSDQLHKWRKARAGGKGWRVKLHLYLSESIISILFSQLNGRWHTEVVTKAKKWKAIRRLRWMRFKITFEECLCIIKCSGNHLLSLLVGFFRWQLKILHYQEAQNAGWKVVSVHQMHSCSPTRQHTQLQGTLCLWISDCRECKLCFC